MHYLKPLFTQNVECTRMIFYLKEYQKLIIVDFKPLPPHLLLQLDNAESDNKNLYVFMFLSLLTTLGVFITIEVGFLLVGYTHEDIDGTQGRMSSNLKSTDIYFLFEMMDRYCTIEEKQAFPPKRIGKVYEFKSFLNGYIKEGKLHQLDILMSSTSNFLYSMMFQL